MSDPNALPPFEVVNLEPTQHAGSKGTRLDIVLSPEDYDRVTDVAVHLVERYARDNFTVWVFFQPTTELVGREMAALRARYVRDDIPNQPRPIQPNPGRQLVDVRLPHGVLTVERKAAS